MMFTIERPAWWVMLPIGPFAVLGVVAFVILLVVTG
jgi:hypothetical protein